MRLRVYLLIFSLSVLMIGCNEINEGSQNNQENPLSTADPINNPSNDYSLPKKAKTVLDQETDTISSYKGIAIDNQVFVAIQANTFKQFTEQKIEKALEDKLKKKLSLKDVSVTSDQKFYMELSKLERKNETNKNKLKKKIEEFKTLMKEQT
ncbi:YhcN/YlaJ family sporulation lipoprotein [Gracilibacillus sp. YIM 98692]|uniref:YhcN/YlaJ family sporulation lipoprotein n=1 Tax=Gracilibacillus sp. YIM 98692 TaxID=2663532 RepID=UPI0013D0DA4D|nr:YhcN/YlaJ family sporulation lipoprotein [Gracilibacillus sp. YIM 98692]